MSCYQGDGRTIKKQQKKSQLDTSELQKLNTCKIIKLTSWHNIQHSSLKIKTHTHLL